LHFNKPVGEMIAQADVFWVAFQGDPSDFEGVDSFLDTAWSTAFQSKINAAKNATTPTEAKAAVSDFTAALVTGIDHVKAQYEKMLYFAKRAYAGTPNVIDNKFGRAEYRKIRLQNDKLIRFMEKKVAIASAD